MIRIEGTRVELWTLPQQVGLLTGPNGDTLTPDQARRLATQLLRAANEAETKTETPTIAEQAEAKARRRAHGDSGGAW